MRDANHIGDELKNIKEFIESADRLALQKSDFVFTSTSPINAAIVMATIMKTAASEVRIYDDKIDGEIADRTDYFKNSLEEFFNSNKKLKIVLREHSDNDSEILILLGEYLEKFSDRLDIRIASEEFKTNIKDAVQGDTNFIVNDQHGFRLEMIKDNEDIREAFSSFNKPEISNKLTEMFDLKFSTCSKFQFPEHA